MKNSILPLILYSISLSVFAGGGALATCRDFDPIVLQEAKLKVNAFSKEGFDIGTAKLVSTLSTCSGGPTGEVLTIFVSLFNFIEPLELDVLNSIFSAEMSSRIRLDAQSITSISRGLDAGFLTTLRLINVSDRSPTPLLEYTFKKGNISFWNSEVSGILNSILSDVVAPTTRFPNYRVLACSAKFFDIDLTFNKIGNATNVVARGSSKVHQVPSICKEH